MDLVAREGFYFLLFLLTDRCVGGIMFSGRPSVRACVGTSVRPGFRLVSAISYKPMDGISPNFVVEATDELIRF